MYKLLNINNIIVENYNHFLNENDKTKINKYINHNDRIRSLGSIILQKECIMSVYKNLVPNEIIINYTKDGKPYYNDVINYNISHDNDLVIILYCITENICNVGVDIMKYKIVDIHNYKSCFSELEKNNLSTETFFKFWCAKEAFLKAIGQGLLIDLHLVEFNIDNNTIKYLDQIHQVHFINIPDYVCAYVTI